MSSESDIRKLLKIRADLENRVEKLQIEIDDLNAVMAEIDKAIVGQGFHQTSTGGFQTMKLPEMKSSEYKPPEPTLAEPAYDGSSIQAKDGTNLGKVQITDYTLLFTPKEGITFTLSTPPFQSFLLDRVLGNMKTTDEAKAASGEITPDQVLSFNVETEGETIKALTIRNYGGERRLREIQSSLRWSLDKMYDKMKRG